ncbi:MAG TPA: type I glyceraldehyde-3-phosphate dehydrogenase [Candidatus Nanoarchaeia archaeon]|nr:type I glyceraldehyde-3-phosphate dehydrogenase [Candidatus Nanoarchaeia archaeon]
MRIAINGFGRIGRIVLRIGINDKSLKFVAINNIHGDAKSLAYLLKYDSMHGIFPGTIKAGRDCIYVNGQKIAMFHEPEPEKLPWKQLKVDVVAESTGAFTTREACGKHITAGARKVLLSAPGKGEEKIKTIVVGVNDRSLNASDTIISNASCTTNCAAPMAKVLNDAFGIEKGYLTTVHSYTNDQMLLDLYHKDARRGRAAAESIIPTSTGAARSVGEVIPDLKGKMDGLAMRVPTPCGSITDLVCILKKEVEPNQVNRAFERASRGKMRRVLQYSEEELVSRDIVGNPYSCIFDSKLTQANEKMVKVIGWYDNEWGFSCRMVDLLKMMR